MRSSCNALAKTHVVVLVCLVLVGVFAGAYYAYSSRLANVGSGLPQASASESPSPVTSLPETVSPSPTPSALPVGDIYEPDNSFTQYSTFDNYSIDKTSDFSFLAQTDRTIYTVGDMDYVRVYLWAGYTYSFSFYALTMKYAYASLYDVNHQLLTSSDNRNSYDQSFEVSYPANQSGYYFLVVGANTVPGDSGEYSIDFTCVVTPVAVTLDEAIAQNLVQVTTQGDGLQQVDISINSLSNSILNVTIIAGTKFEVQSPGTQSMVVLFDNAASIEPNGKATVYVSTACTNMYLEMPTGNDTFAISHDIPSDLVKLLNASSFGKQSFRVEQFAVWTITDNPVWGGYTEIGTAGNYSGPSIAEMQSVEALFWEAGINPQDYKAFP